MIFSILAMALAVSAVLLDERDPTDTNPAPEPAPGGGSGGSGKCNGGQKQACCTGLLGVLTCNIQILGSTCNQEKYCCSTSAPVVSIPFTLSPTPWSLRVLLIIFTLLLSELLRLANANCHWSQGAALVNINAANCVKIL
jgi:hypothetical protein